MISPSPHVPEKLPRFGEGDLALARNEYPTSFTATHQMSAVTIAADIGSEVFDAILETEPADSAARFVPQSFEPETQLRGIVVGKMFGLRAFLDGQTERRRVGVDADAGAALTRPIRL